MERVAEVGAQKFAAANFSSIFDLLFSSAANLENGESKMENRGLHFGGDRGQDPPCDEWGFEF